jgi:hypothetical protein
MYAPINITASKTLTAGDANTVITVNAAAGLTLTLPAAAGTGRRYEIVIGTTVTSNSVMVKVANASDTMRGVAICAQDGGDTVVAFEAGATADTITMNGSTTGGLLGDRIILVDVAATLWSVNVIMAGTGSEVTPFSATVN